MKPAPIDEAGLRRLYEDGAPMSTCARHFCVSIGTIHRRLKKLGVRSRPEGGTIEVGSPILDGVPGPGEDKATYMRAYRRKNRDKIKAQEREYKERNKEKIEIVSRKYLKGYYAANKEKYAKAGRAAYLANREKYKTRAAEHKRRQRAEDPEGYKAKVAAYMRRRRASDVRHVLDGRMSNMIWYAFRRKKAGRSWKTMVPYTVAGLRAHLETTMPDGYDWPNFMAGELHIDHIIPRSAFNYRVPEDHDFKRCWALSNLQLLPARENQSKGARLEQPFQPALI